MECLFQFLDEVDDFIIATALGLQRSLSPKPRERRQVPRTAENTVKPIFAPGRKRA
jgi:hypothetical protein